MIAFDSGVSMLGVALSSFEDAAMLCCQKTEWCGERGVSHLMESGWFWRRFLNHFGVFLGMMANSGSSLVVSPCGLMAWMYGAIFSLVAEMGGCGFGASCCSVVLAFEAAMGGCCYRVGCCLGCCLVVAKARAAFVELFFMTIRPAAAAILAAFQSYNFDSFRVAPEAPACEYLCNMRDQHAAAATAAALGETFTFIPVREDVSESAALFSWLSGIVLFCDGIWILFGARRDLGKVSSNPLGKGKIRVVQKDVKGSSEPSDLQALIQEDFDCFADEDGELHLHQDHVDFKGKDGHDTDGSLSLVLGRGFRTGGRPRQCWRVAQLRKSSAGLRSLSPSLPWLLRCENDL